MGRNNKLLQRNDKVKILFITEKWCDGKQELGLTNSYHNIFGSYVRSDVAKEHDFFIAHFDESYLKYNVHIDNIRKKLYNNIKPDLIICTLMGKSVLNPSKTFFNFFKKKGVKICLMWPDIGHAWGIDQIEQLNDVCDFHVSWAMEENIESSEKILWLWTPEDPSLFFCGEEEKDIDVSFLGTVHTEERFECLNFLKNNLSGAKIHISGGQRQRGLSHKQYAEITRKSKIVINFPMSPSGFNQLKGRVFESLASKCLLLEKTNDKTRKYFTPLLDYIEFTDKEELLRLATFYLKNEQQRIKIAENGYRKFNELYTNNHFWRRVLNNVGFDNL